MPSFALQKAVSTTIRDNGINYWTGTVYTTNRRVWEFDGKFKKYLKKIRAYAIDMETATLFTVGFHNKIPTGALLLVTDSPMVPDGVKTLEKDKVNSKLFDERHVKVGIESLQQLMNNGDTIRHLVF
jgi:AMP nucleosidase